MGSESGCCISEIFVWVLRKGFRKLGYSIGKYPWLYCGITTLICLMLTGGFLRAKLANNVRDGYTPLDAPSRKEQETFVTFFNNEPFLSYILVRARDGGSLLRLQHLKSCVELLDFLMDDFQVEFEGKNQVMRSVCHPFCDENEIVRRFYLALKAQIVQMNSSDPAISAGTVAKLDYPISNIFHKDFFLPGHFYGVEMKERTNESDWNLPTSIASVELIQYKFRNMKINKKEREFLEKWEGAVFEFSQNFEHPLINMSIMSQVGVTREVVRAGLVSLPYFPLGIGIMLLFAVGTVTLSAHLNPRVGLKNAKPWVTLLGVICPVLATGGALGTVFLMGYEANSVLSVVPFLVLAIGVDDAFLIIHAWQKTPGSMPVPDRTGLVLANVGPSVAITSLTNCVAFAIGALTPTPAIQLLCIATSVGMMIDFLCELTFFCAVLAISGRREVPVDDTSDSENSSTSSDSETQKQSKLTIRVKSLVSDCVSQYCRFLSRWPALIVVLLFLGGFWSFSIYGVLRMKVELSSEKLWLKDSPMLPTMIARTEYIWHDYHSVLILVNRSPDFGDYNQSLEFTEMVEAFESIDRSLGRQSTRLWAIDYQKFVSFANFGENVWGDYDTVDYGDQENDPTTEPREIIGDFGLQQLPDFFRIADYEHWNATVYWSYNPNGTPKVDRFAFSTAYHDCTSWGVRIELMEEWRALAAQYPQFDVSVWEYDGFFVDQILTLKTVTLRTVLITLCSMALVCFLFIPNLWCVVVASLSTASISLGVYGVLSWWGIDLDPISMASLIMSIGFSVDYTAHISYHYYQERSRCTAPSLPGSEQGSRCRSMHATLRAVGWPMIQAGISTVVAVFPLSWVNSYMASVFVKTVFLVSVCGLLHGLFIVPAILANFPDSLNGLLTPWFLKGNPLRSWMSRTDSSSSVSSGSAQQTPPLSFKRALSQRALLRRLVWSNRVVPASVGLDAKTGKTVIQFPDGNNMAEDPVQE